MISKWRNAKNIVELYEKQYCNHKRDIELRRTLNGAYRGGSLRGGVTPPPPSYPPPGGGDTMFGDSDDSDDSSSSGGGGGSGGGAISPAYTPSSPHDPNHGGGGGGSSGGGGNTEEKRHSRYLMNRQFEQSKTHLKIDTTKPREENLAVYYKWNDMYLAPLQTNIRNYTTRYNEVPYICNKINAFRRNILDQLTGKVLDPNNWHFTRPAKRRPTTVANQDLQETAKRLAERSGISEDSVGSSLNDDSDDSDDTDDTSDGKVYNPVHRTWISNPGFNYTCLELTNCKFVLPSGRKLNRVCIPFEAVQHIDSNPDKFIMSDCALKNGALIHSDDYETYTNITFLFGPNNLVFNDGTPIPRIATTFYVMFDMIHHVFGDEDDDSDFVKVEFTPPQKMINTRIAEEFHRMNKIKPNSVRPTSMGISDMNVYYSEPLSAALLAYSRHWDVLVNAFMRNGYLTPSQISPVHSKYGMTHGEVTNKVKQLIQTLKTGFKEEAMRAPNGLKVYRGMGSKFVPGADGRVQMESFSSTSLDKIIAMRFAGGGGGLYTIDVSYGIPVLHLGISSYYRHEDELLFPPGVQLDNIVEHDKNGHVPQFRATMVMPPNIVELYDQSSVCKEFVKMIEVK